MKQIFALLFSVTQIVQCETIEVTYSKNVTAQIGDTIIIRLRENPTTGYSWQMDIPETEAVKLQEDAYVAPDTNLVGAGGIHKWQLKVTTSGTVKITGTYCRPWKKNMSPARRFECKITVQ